MMGFYNDHGGIPRIDKLSNRFRVSLRVQGSKFKAGAQAMAFFCDTQEWGNKANSHQIFAKWVNETEKVVVLQPFQ
jgi:hypothetical protein